MALSCLTYNCDPQEIYKDPDFRSMGQSVVRTAMALNESVAFVLAQMTLEGQRAAESDLQLKTDLAKQRHENGRLTMQVAAVRGLLWKGRLMLYDVQGIHFE